MTAEVIVEMVPQPREELSANRHKHQTNTTSSHQTTSVSKQQYLLLKSNCLPLPHLEPILASYPSTFPAAFWLCRGSYTLCRIFHDSKNILSIFFWFHISSLNNIWMCKLHAAAIQLRVMKLHVRLAALSVDAHTLAHESRCLWLMSYKIWGEFMTQFKIVNWMTTLMAKQQPGTIPDGNVCKTFIIIIITDAFLP